MSWAETILGSMPTRPPVRLAVHLHTAPSCSHIFRATATCPKCDHERAYFYQLQIRSADEPMTTCTFIV